MSTAIVHRVFGPIPPTPPELSRENIARLSDAQGLRERIYTELGRIGVAEGTLEHSYVRLGSALAEFKRGEYWRDLKSAKGTAYLNLDEFMVELRERYRKGRTQLWAYLSVCEKLLPSIPAVKLDEIGISKAQELKRALKYVPNRQFAENVITTAADSKVTIKELRAVLHETYEIVDDGRPAGTWFDFGGAYLTTEERKEFVDAIRVCVRVLGLKKETADWIQRKECLLAMAREFLGTHAADVYGPEASDGNSGQ